MYSVVDKALGYVHSPDAMLAPEVSCCEDHLVHTGAIVGQIVVALELTEDVVSIYDGVLADLRDALFPEREYV